MFCCFILIDEARDDHQAAERLQDIRAAGVGVLLNIGIAIEHRSTDAVAAVHGLFGDKRLLNGMRVLYRAQTFNGRDGMTSRVGDCGDAGADRLAVQ